MKKVRLELALLLPEMAEGDRCVRLLTQRFNAIKGIEEAHVVRDNGTAHLCLHYDPNLIALGRVQRLAQETGAQVTDRYRHEQLPFAGMDSADAAPRLARALQSLPGMLHANVNYAAGLIAIAYDREVLQRSEIERTIRQQGVRLLAPETKPAPAEGIASEAEREGLRAGDQEEIRREEAEGSGHDHGNAPGFLPHWMQERWSLILVGLAGLFFLIGWIGGTFLGLDRNVALVFFVLAYITGGYDVALHAIPGLLKGNFDTDVLMLAAAAGAAILGEWAEGAFLLFLFSLGHAGEHYALDRARNAVNALGELMPKTARVRRGDRIEEIPVAEVELDEVVLVRPGDRIPVDGTVSSGTSAVDQSPITGESVPVEKGPDDEVFAGTINQMSALEVKVTALAEDNTLNRVMQMVQEAQSQQSPTQQFTQRFTAWFVPAVLVADLLVMGVPPLLGWMPFHQSFYRAMLLLVAASPCALAIGTPAAVLAGIAQSARNGVLIKGGVHLENLGGLKAIAFDKTGTLTQGTFEVAEIEPLNGTAPDELLRVAAAVEQQSSHPLALAVVQAAQARSLSLPPTNGLENVAGQGVHSQVNGEPVSIGSLKLFQEKADQRVDEAAVQTVQRLEEKGRSTMVVSQNGRVLGVLGLADVARDHVPATMQRLRDLGVARLIMLTGDNADVARRIGDEVGVTDVRAQLLPAEKLDAIHELERTHGSIAMVGDGVNDAPALATATVGIAMGGAGTAVALETADVALMADDLDKLPFAVGLSRASRAVIRQNLGIALGVIALLLLTSVLGWIQLSAAVVLHEGSTIVVVLNALRLLRFRVG